MRRRLAGLFLVLAALLACKRSPPTADPDLEHRAGTQIQLAPPGDLATVLPDMQTRARGEGRQVLVYLGASWCKPCKAFKADVRAGRYDASMGKFRFIEFDAAYDDERLGAAGCASSKVPTFASIDAQGRCVSSYSGYGSPSRMSMKFRQLASP